MASYNKILIIGNLTRDPEYKQLSSGQAVCRLGVAVNRQFKNKQTGAVTQEVCYIDVDVWGYQAESCKQYLSKGRPVLVEGRLKYDSWKDEQNGQMRSKHSILADRVEFLPANTGASDGQSANVEDESLNMDAGKKVAAARPVSTPNMAAQSGPQFALEKELLGQIEQIKERAAAKAQIQKKAPKKTDGIAGGILEDVDAMTFKDEPPFEDELPF